MEFENIIIYTKGQRIDPSLLKFKNYRSIISPHGGYVATKMDFPFSLNPDLLKYGVKNKGKAGEYVVVELSTGVAFPASTKYFERCYIEV